MVKRLERAVETHEGWGADAHVDVGSARFEGESQEGGGIHSSGQVVLDADLILRTGRGGFVGCGLSRGWSGGLRCGFGNGGLYGGLDFGGAVGREGLSFLGGVKTCKDERLAQAFSVLRGDHALLVEEVDGGEVGHRLESSH
jgi:hypothetical protein